MNPQVSKDIGEKLSIYLGGENLFNYRQLNPIFDADNPFGDYFEASLVWGRPVFGRKVYEGEVQNRLR